MNVLVTSWCGDIAGLVRNHEGIRIPLLGSGREVELGEDASAREGIRDEVVLAEDEERVAEALDDVLGGDLLGFVEDFVRLFGKVVENGSTVRAGDVNKLCYSTCGAVYTEKIRK